MVNVECEHTHIPIILRQCYSRNTRFMCFETINMIIVNTIKTSDDECYRFPVFKLHFLLALFSRHLTGI